MSAGVVLLAQAGGQVSTGEEVTFWILGPLALLGAVALVLARNAVHSALFLVLTMLSLGVLYMVQQSPFLGFVQIIVYTGAIMMLFLFVLMLVGRDSSDSVVEVLRGQRLAGAVLGLGFAGTVVAVLARALTDVRPAGLSSVNGTGGGNVAQIGALLFTQYLFPFELTSALLIVAALGAMVLAFTASDREGKATQRERVVARLRGDRISPLPGPGVFATANSVATPALLPDGSVAPESLSAILDSVTADRLSGDLSRVRGGDDRPGARALAPGGSAPGGGRPVTPTYYLLLSALLFTIGAVGVLVRRNAVVVFMCVELMLNAVNLTLVTFSRINGDLQGQLMAFFVMVVAAAEVVVGLAIIMAIFRTRRSSSVDDANLLKY